MQQTKPTPTRKKILLWGAALISSVTVFKLFKWSNNAGSSTDEKNTESVKMLSQDGKLVEIKKSLLLSSGKKISDEELKKWVKK